MAPVATLPVIVSPPVYADLGKPAKDLFNKGYHYGSVKLDVKTKTDNGINFTFTGLHNTDIHKSLGTLEAKYKNALRGIEFTEKWNTDNLLKSELSAENNIVRGLKVALDTSYAPASGKKSAVLKTLYKHEKASFNTDVELDPAGPVINNALVVGHMGWLLGAQTSWDTAKSVLTHSNFAVGYVAPDFSLHTEVQDSTEVSAAIHQYVNKDLQLGVSLSWSSLNSSTKFALATKYQLDNSAFVQAKVNNASQVGLSFSQKLASNANLVLSSLIDCKNINGGGHKVGLALEFNH